MKGIDTVAKLKGQIKDLYVLGAVSGFVGVIVMDIAGLMLFAAKKTELTYGHLTAGVFVRHFRSIRTKRPGNFWLGEIFHIFDGMGLGVSLALILKKTGKHLYLVKGLMLGGLTWQVLYAIGTSLGPLRVKPNLAKTHYSSLFLNLLFGIAASQAVVTLAHPSVFRELPKHKPRQLTSESKLYRSLEAGNTVNNKKADDFEHYTIQ